MLNIYNFSNNRREACTVKTYIDIFGRVLAVKTGI